MTYTPDNISSLKENEIFVFGSNLSGQHGGGAARVAYEQFGAVWGQGVGLQGQCYAIPTMHGGPDAIKPYVDEFITFASSRPDLTFLVTRIGCGIAGFRDDEIAPLFAKAYHEPNIVLPETFAAYIERHCPEAKPANICDGLLHCPDCGAVIDTHDIFCPSCGNKSDKTQL